MTQRSFATLNAPVAADAGIVKTFYINFDGDTIENTSWNYSSPSIVFEAATLNFSDKQAIVARVQDAYAPYNVKVTASAAVFNATPPNARGKCDVGKYNAAISSPSGGIAYIGSMWWGDDTPCFVFSDLLGNTVKKVSDATAHEFGHISGMLQHDVPTSTVDGNCSVTASYRSSVGSGPLSWGSIMGNSYLGTVSTFVSDATTGCGSVENELGSFTSQLGLKTDDVGNDIANAETVDTRKPYIKNLVINSSADVDMFKITDDAPCYVTLSSKGTTDFKIILYDANGVQLTELNPTNTLSIKRTDISSWVKLTGTLYLAVERSNDDAGSYIPTTSGNGGAILRISR